MWKKRIEQLMQEKGWNQYDLADRAGYSQPHIHKILKREEQPVPKALRKLADAFGVPVEYFTSGIQRPVGGHLDVPLLKPDQITAWMDQPDSVRDSISQWIPAVCSCSDKAYSVTVSGNDMSGPQSPNHYPMGSIIIVDPEKPRQAGYRVLCQLPDQRVIFRELQESAGEYYLAALQPSFAMIPLGSEFNARYLGRVVSTIIHDRD